MSLVEWVVVVSGGGGGGGNKAVLVGKETIMV